MKTRVKSYRNFEAAKQFYTDRGTEGYNVGADLLVEDDKRLWLIYWSAGYINVKQAVEA